MVGYKTQKGFWAPTANIKEENESKRIRTNYSMD